MGITTEQVTYYVDNKMNRKKRPRQRKSNLNQEEILEAYDSLPNDDKLLRPVPAIRERIGHGTDTIRRILRENQKYESNGQKGLWARNKLAPGYSEGKGTKRKEAPTSSKVNAPLKKTSLHKRRRTR